MLRVGEVAAWTTAALIAFAVAGFFVWPHVFGMLSAEQVLTGIRAAPARFVMRLDPVVLLASLTQLPLFLALWIALRRASPTVATLALLSGVTGVAAMLPTRPIVELYALAELHAAAAGAAEAGRYVAGAEVLLAQFHGMSWAVGIVLGGLAGIGFGAAMLRAPSFRRITGWTGVIAATGSLAFFVPVVGLVLLFVLGTIGSVVWLGLVARDLREVRRHEGSRAADDPLAA